MYGHWSSALFASWLTLQAWLDWRLLQDADDAASTDAADRFIDG